MHHRGLGKSRGPGGASRRKKFLRAGTDACSNLYAYIDRTDGEGEEEEEEERTGKDEKQQVSVMTCNSNPSTQAAEAGQSAV